MSEDSATIHGIETRVVLIESELGRMASTRRVMGALALGLVIQAVVMVYSFGKMAERLDRLSDGEITANVSRLNVITVDHGSEIRLANEDISALRGVMDGFYKEHSKLNSDLKLYGKDRFYRADGLKLEARILRLEDYIINTKPED